MSERTSYAILLSFMALFAALAADAKEPAAAERAAVLSSVHDQAAYAKALEAYDRRLTHVFAPEPVKGVVAKAKRKRASAPKSIAKAEPVKAEPPKTVVAKTEPVGEPRGQPLGQPIANGGPRALSGVSTTDSTAAAVESASSRTEEAASTISSSAM